mmetsp:Transcript_8204/g.9554  ORF Transcript_8204/g.9554 Transcript_8204/m.9554 type:complete len:543 (+) Transcript_8204:1-1629(+)
MKPSSTHYQSVVVINDATAVDPNESWVQAHVEEVKYSYAYANKADEHEDDPSVSQRSSAPPKFRDLPFAILFLLHLGVVSFIALACGTFDGLFTDMDVQDTSDPDVTTQTRDWVTGVMYMVVPAIIVSFLVCHFITGTFVLKYPTQAVTVSLYSSIWSNVAFMFIICFTFPSFWLVLLTSICTLWSIWFVFAVRRFIPFAAAILKLAVAGITVNWGMYMVSLVTAAISCAWYILWVYVANGIGFFQDVEALSDEDRGKGDIYYNNGVKYYTSYYVGDGKVLTVVLMLLSLYWTSVVIMNVTQTTVAGVIGTFAFEKSSASSCCSMALTQSIIRSCTYSFGSICFGSLLNAIMITLRVLLDWSRQRARDRDNNGAALLYCILQCIVSILGDLLEYFNQWAYIFVGIYGTTYLQSGQRVLELFKARGCTSIISNGLASYVLGTVVMVVGLICGILGWIVIYTTSFMNMNLWVAFWAWFIMGAIIASVMMNAVQGAIKAIVVCYFDHPGKMYQSHPQETRALADAIELLFPQVTVFAFSDNAFTV